MTDLYIDELIRSRRKTLTLTITREAKLVVRAPLKLPMKEIEKLVMEKESWIRKKRKQAKDRLGSLESCKVEEGGQFFFLGRPLTLYFNSEVQKTVYKEGFLLIPAKDSNEAGLLLKKWYRTEAKKYLTQRLAEISSRTGIPYALCRISSARRRWGSCSGQNHIHLTWRLIMAQPQAVDYVLIHELCHVVHKNHSSAFWNKVEALMLDFREQRKWLKDNAYILDILE